MVSRKLQSVIHQIDVMLMEGLTPTPAILRSMRTILQGAEATARTLEGSQVPSRQRLTKADLADGKIAVFPTIPRPGFQPTMGDGRA